jgi:hypothetical protein
MRLFAIGDIHGCATALDVILAAICLRTGDKIVSLGDYINKGPETKAVLDRLIRLFDRGFLIPLLGNHELKLPEAGKVKQAQTESGVLVDAHTPQRNGQPINLGHAICLDTAACEGHWLTCLEVNSGQVWQANQRRQLRTSNIEDYYGLQNDAPVGQSTSQNLILV